MLVSDWLITIGNTSRGFTKICGRARVSRRLSWLLFPRLDIKQSNVSTFLSSFYLSVEIALVWFCIQYCTWPLV